MEKVKKMWNSFKSGIITWVFAYLAMYLIANHIGAMDKYNAQVLKLVDGVNFFYQILVSGITYVVLEVYMIGFMNKVIESIDKNSVKNTVKNLIISIVIWILVGLLLSKVEVEAIISDSILTFMLLITLFKVIFYVIGQQINTFRFNKKLNEKIKEESL